MTTAIVPQNLEHLGGNDLFEFDGYDPLQAYGPDRVAFHQLKCEFDSQGEELVTIDTTEVKSIDTCIFVDMDYDYLDRLLSIPEPPTLVYMMREPPSVIPENAESRLVRFAPLFDLVLTWNGRLADLDRFVEYDIPQYLDYEPSLTQDFKERSLLVNITSRKYSNHPEELYSARQEVLHFFDEKHPDEFSLYGRYWNQSPRLGDIYYHHQFSSPEYDTYRGLADSKVEVYRQHRFVLCFENMTGIDGYVTEKIFDCFRAGAVPIYWGANDITEYVPSETFVDYREFGSPEALHEYLVSMDERQHREYVEMARAFLDHKPDALTPERFAETVYNSASEARRREQSDLPTDLRRYVARRGAEERFVRQAGDISLREYLWRLGSVVRQRPNLLIDNPSIMLHSIRNRQK